MLRTSLFVVAVGLAFTPIAFAQEQENQQIQQEQAPPPPQARQAIPRAEAPRPAPVQPAAVPASSGDDQRRAVPRGERPRGDNPPVGTAVPREQVRRAPPPPPPDSSGPRTRSAGPRNAGRVYVAPPVYNNYYYYPQRYYPYGYGAFGLGYFYYDPYTWYSPRSYSAYGGYGYPGYSGYYPGRAYSVFDVGELRLQVAPRYAQVYVDGYFAGEVDDYDGVLQAMKLESGPYHIEIVAPGYETLEFDIRITPGQKINYRGVLRPRP